MGDANGNGGQRQGGLLSRGAAVYALVGAVNIPIINRSVVWWNSLHQGPSITLGGSSIDNALLWPLGLTVLAFSLLFGAIVLMRLPRIIADNRGTARLRRLADEAERRVPGVLTVCGQWGYVAARYGVTAVLT